jgi:hypothetical protein
LIDRGKKANNVFNLMGPVPEGFAGWSRIARIITLVEKICQESRQKERLWQSPALFALVNGAKGDSHLVSELFLGKLQLNPKGPD